MADANQQPRSSTVIHTDKGRSSRMLNRAACRVQHAGGSFFHLLTTPSAAGPIILTCLCLAIAYKSRRRARYPRPPCGAGKTAGAMRPMLHRSMSLAVLHGGHTVLQRIIDSQEARLSEEMLEKAEAEFENLLQPSDGRMHFGKLQSLAGKLEMSGKEDQAAAMLRKAMEKAKPHEAHELGMLLVEMLIYKGEYNEALSTKCLHDEEISDARAPLYKAVIYSVKEDTAKSVENYKEFQKMQSKLQYPDAEEESPLYDTVHRFDKFQTVVSNLKTEIEQVKAAKIH